MFRGSYEHAIDDKGRVNIPVKFREVLSAVFGDNQLVVTNFIVDGVRCLDAYPLTEWVALEQDVRQRPRFDRRRLAFEAYYMTGAQECSVDRQGRILIPPILREYAGLRKDVMFAGFTEKFRIFDKQALDRLRQAAESVIGAESVISEKSDILDDLKL